MKNRYLAETESFLVQNRRDDVGWPRVLRPQHRPDSRGRVFICGDLVARMRIVIAAPFSPQIVSSWQRGRGLGCPCHVGAPMAGGLPATAAPLAAALGFDVAIACTVALPAPRLIRDFLECGRFDAGRAVAYPGPTPLSLEIQFADRIVRIAHPSGADLPRPPMPHGLGEEFDAVLADPGPPCDRPHRLKSLIESCRAGARGARLAVVGRGDWSAAELEVLQGQHSWLFLTGEEALETARRITGQQPISDLREAILTLKDHLGPSVYLVATQGEQGAYLMNGADQPLSFATQRVARERCSGAREVLGTYALLASVLGCSDEDATRIAVTAATERVAGRLCPPLAVN